MWGQYITLQQYNKVTSGRYMECYEVDVTIFTGPFRVDDNTPCNMVEVDYCANRALITSGKP